MAIITPPAYQKDAIPTPQGWRHPKTGELLHAIKLSVEDIDAYNNPTNMTGWIPEPVDEVVYEEDEDWEEAEIDLDSMTKAAIKEILEGELF